jgi:hypothetical protein
MAFYDTIAQAYLNRFKKPEPAALTESTEEQYLAEEVLCESRLDWLKKNTKPTMEGDKDVTFAHDPHGPAKTIPDLVDHIAKHGDPTPNKVHTQWLTNIYKKGAFKQEDLYKAHEALSKFEGTPATKDSEGVRGIKHDLKPEQRIINHKTYPTIQHLQKAMMPDGMPQTKIKDNLEKWHASGRGGHEQIFDDEHIRVYKLHPTEEGKEASKAIYGGGCDKGGTEWCTANHNEEHNYFNNYLHEQHPGSHLYVIHRKSDGEVFQYHTHSDQFMDKNDETIKHDDLKTILPSVHKMWDQNYDYTDPPKK